jgi:hypothetical protein
MKTLLFLPLLLLFIPTPQNPTATSEACPVAVVAFKWTKTHLESKTPDPAVTGPATPVPEVQASNKNSAKNARGNDPAGARDPNQDSIDTRSAALEKAVQESRAPKAKVVDGFAYQVKVHNAATKVIEVVFWEYQFFDSSTPANLTRRQFVCDVNVKADRDKELQAFGLLGPSDVVSVQSLANSPASVARENVVINRIEYKDGSYWQRQDWNVAEIKLTYHIARSTPWAPDEMCRGL